jgi:hypothetical protein
LGVNGPTSLPAKRELLTAEFVGWNGMVMTTGVEEGDELGESEGEVVVSQLITLDDFC